MPTPETASILSAVKDFAEDFTPQLSQCVTESESAPPKLVEAMRYSLLGPGKRLRPFLVHECCALAGGRQEDAFAPAAALEMVHAFSLVHDDLPAMDDDDLRRGRPTNHKVYGEALAILAGDALLALAFEVLATRSADASTTNALVAELARATGLAGMIGGQVGDLEGEHAPPELDRVRRIGELKTGALFRAACRMGGIAGGANETTISALGDYGTHLGLAFQIADDLLDLTASAEQLGKNTGKDSSHGKQTYPACVGIDASRTAGEQAVAQAFQALKAMEAPDSAPRQEATDRLRALARFAMSRSS